MKVLIDLMVRGLVPDILVRLFVRLMLRDRLQGRRILGIEGRCEADRALIGLLRRSPIALSPERPDEHFYEFSPVFFQHVLGRRMKYSCGYWSAGVDDVNGAEEAMLELTCRRARVEDGMDILDLGCGAGSLSFWIAEKYPSAKLLAVSNVKQQREFIEDQCRDRGITNLEVITEDINRFQTQRRFDRVISVEMFDHIRNYRILMERNAEWLKPEGKLFVHMTTHREYNILAEKTVFEEWMAKHFFYGGLVASDALLLHFQDDLILEDHWHVDGNHFRRTANAWLAKLDSHKELIQKDLRSTFSDDEADRWLNRWRIMLMVFEELFAYGNGEEWMISHYLFGRRRT